VLHDIKVGFATNMARTNIVEYNKLLTDFGVSPEDSDRLIQEIGRINEASLEAEGAIKNLLKARYDYKEDIRAVLGNEAYWQYTQYENTKPARRELDGFKAYANQTAGIVIDPATEQSLASIIQAEGAYTSPDLLT
jgi:hypothetical protein